MSTTEQKSPNRIIIRYLIETGTEIMAYNESDGMKYSQILTSDLLFTTDNIIHETINDANDDEELINYMRVELNKGVWTWFEVPHENIQTVRTSPYVSVGNEQDIDKLVKKILENSYDKNIKSVNQSAPSSSIGPIQASTQAQTSPPPKKDFLGLGTKIHEALEKIKMTEVLKR